MWLPSVFHIIVTHSRYSKCGIREHTHLGSSDRTDTCNAQTDIIVYIVTYVAPPTDPHKMQWHVSIMVQFLDQEFFSIRYEITRNRKQCYVNICDQIHFVITMANTQEWMACQFCWYKNMKKSTISKTLFTATSNDMKILGKKLIRDSCEPDFCREHCVCIGRLCGPCSAKQSLEMEEESDCSQISHSGPIIIR
jgi:hypothetical protein